MGSGTIGNMALEQADLAHQDSIISTLENGRNCDVIYLDFAKAYDRVDHSILLSKLCCFGIVGKIE